MGECVCLCFILDNSNRRIWKSTEEDPKTVRSQGYGIIKENLINKSEEKILSLRIIISFSLFKL